MLSPTANMDGCRRLVNDIESIFELLSDCESENPLLMPEEYCVKEFVELDGRVCLCILYTLCEGACEERSQEVESLKSTITQSCDMCMSLAGENYFTGGYEIKIMKALNEEVRELVEVIVSAQSNRSSV